MNWFLGRAAGQHTESIYIAHFGGTQVRPERALNSGQLKTLVFLCRGGSSATVSRAVECAIQLPMCSD